ncbi:hypothetical protein [Burkholderia anthina]|uniref:hypothetical protein n=1 Tax=Burkholderia anthina TaxID=179879 RepID=UPI00158EF0A1|nr:hypothetical protein [Burkholderia anthina]
MPKSEWPLRFICAHGGCGETVTYRFDTRRDLVSSYELKHYSGGRWKCLRHSDPDRVLTVENLETRHELVSTRSEHGGLYFGGQGFISGPGFLLYAKDFPAGTKLIVTARIELPAEVARAGDAS